MGQFGLLTAGGFEFFAEMARFSGKCSLHVSLNTWERANSLPLRLVSADNTSRIIGHGFRMGL